MKHLGKTHSEVNGFYAFFLVKRSDEILVVHGNDG